MRLKNLTVFRSTKQTLQAALACVGIAALVLSQAQAAETAQVQFLTRSQEKPTIDAKTWILYDHGTRSICILKGKPASMPTVIKTKSGQYALRMELAPTSGKGPDGGRDKINYTIVTGHDPYAPKFGGPMVYLAFSVKLDAQDFQAPTSGRGYLIAQWWQGAPFGPPLALDLLPAKSASDDVPIAFGIRNSQTGGNPGAPTIYQTPDHTKVLKRGVWYHFIVGTKFGIHEDGELKVWVGNDSRPELDWHGSIGYDAFLSASKLGYHSGDSKDKHPSKGIDVFVGPYRDRMQSEQVFYFSDLAYGPSYQSVVTAGAP